MSRHVDGPASAFKRPRRPRVQMDHLVLVPASELPFKEEWRAVVDGLPAGEVLLVVPKAETALRQTLCLLAPQLRAKGRHVTAVSAERCA